tara:strand:- start:135 stop:473 length:339 start_codon:yes stop_codon:yes gene_type:complete
MAREIRLSGIGDHFEQQVINTVRKATLKAEKDIKEFTPVDTGNLRNSFKNKVEPFVGEVFTNVEYAEPVAYGTNLPPSWGGTYRTRQNTIKGYPELIAKQLEQYISDQFRSA